MSWSTDFPRLKSNNHTLTSPSDMNYNCVAWAAEDMTRWWQPGEFWPVPDWPSDDFGVGALHEAFATLGFASCEMNTRLEPGFVKVALYGSGLMYTHAARQLASGKWTSKLGKGEDIEHDDPEDVSGGLYGNVVEIMKRPIVTPETPRS